MERTQKSVNVGYHKQSNKFLSKKGYLYALTIYHSPSVNAQKQLIWLKLFLWNNFILYSEVIIRHITFFSSLYFEKCTLYIIIWRRKLLSILVCKLLQSSFKLFRNFIETNQFYNANEEIFLLEMNLFKSWQ